MTTQYRVKITIAGQTTELPEVMELRSWNGKDYLSFMLPDGCWRLIFGSGVIFDLRGVPPPLPPETFESAAAREVEELLA